jgi:hypothetical protein
MSKIKAAIIAAVAGVGIMSGAGIAHADSADPTVGDSVVYYFYADTYNAGASSWYDQNNDMQSYTYTHLPATSKLGHAYGTKRFTSASTYQLLGASIQTNGYYAGCAIYVNGVQKDVENSTGHYAVATCAA